jgi:AAA+ superfamily predicted ATPase
MDALVESYDRFGQPVTRPASSDGDGWGNEKPLSAPPGGGATRLFLTESLPNPKYRELWDKTYVDLAIKTQLGNAMRFHASIRDLRISKRPIRGIYVLVGEAGVGKSSLARGAANLYAECVHQRSKSKVFLLDALVSEFFSDRLGQSAKAARQAAETIGLVIAHEPAVVIIDEFDSVAMNRNKFGAGDPTELHRFVNEFLKTLDRLSASPNFLLIGTSNHPNSIDPAVLDRVDAFWRLDYPNRDAAEAILLDQAKIYRACGIRVSEEVIPAFVAKRYSDPANPPRLSGRMLGCLFMRAVFQYGTNRIETEHLLGVVRALATGG